MKTMEWVDFAAVKSAVSLRMVIEHYGIRLRPSGPNRLRGKCPLPTHSSKDSTESFIATLDKGKGGAWSCHSSSCASARDGKLGGNALDLVAALENCSLREAALKLQSWFLLPSGKLPARKPVNELEQKLVSEGNDRGGESESNKPLGFILQNIDHAHPYLAERGIEEATARKFGVGYFPGKGSMHSRLVVPIHNEGGELIAYAGRSVDGTEPRYLFPAGFKKGLEVFNLHRAIGGPSAVLCEGFFDAMKVAQAGYASIALMGCTMSKAQEDLIAKHFGSVVVMLDGDDAGQKAMEEIADRLQRVVFRVNTIELDSGVQPDMLSEEELRHKLDTIAW